MPQRKGYRRVLGAPGLSGHEGATSIGAQFERQIDEHPARDLIIAKVCRLFAIGMDITDPAILRQAIGAAEHEQARGGRPPTPPSDPRPHLGVHVVYYARLDRLVKIGTTGNIRLRTAQLHAEGIIAVEFGDVTLERQRQSQLAASHHHGEWFRLDAALGAHITDVRAAFETQVGMSTEAWLTSRPRV